MGVIETGRGNATVMNTYIKKNGCHLDSISGYATVMNTYMENKKIIVSQDVKTYRLQMVQDALKYGIKPCARHYQTTVKTVRKWVKRYQQYKEDGLNDLSRKKTHCLIKIDKETELQIVKCRKDHPGWGARRIKEVLELNFSHVSIHRVIKDAGLILPKRKKYKKRKDMQEVRKQKKVFSRFQIDIKYLTDIPEFEIWRWEHHFPLYLISARDYKTGAIYLAYSYEKSSTATALFIDYLLSSLQNYGINPQTIIIQTDNGKEFINPTDRKVTLFEKIVKEKYQATHFLIPYRRPTWNSDVESFHNLIEEEFFISEKPNNDTELLAKTFAYQIWFNSYRNNRGRNNQNPEQIFQSELNTDKPIPLIPPIIVDNYMHLIGKDIKGGYFLPLPPIKGKHFA